MLDDAAGIVGAPSPNTHTALVDASYARKLVTAISGGVFDLLYPVLERDSVDDLGELV